MISNKFEEITRNIWHNINLSNVYGTIYGEETITDSILLELAKQNYFNIRIIQTPKHQEGVRGTDWEWFVGSYKFGWIRYAIQAKKINPNTFRYDKLNHIVGKPPNAIAQSKLLRKYSNVNGAIPLYNFYNYYSNVNEKDHWNCCQTFEKELLGWTFTTLANVEKAISIRGYRSFDQIHKFKNTLPIRCLFNCSYFKSIYQDKNTIGGTGKFLNESFRKVARLPNQFINAREIGILGEFPEEIYNQEIKIYPKRIAIIEVDNEE